MAGGGQQDSDQTVVSQTMCTLGKIVEGRRDTGLTTYCFFPDVQKAHDAI